MRNEEKIINLIFDPGKGTVSVSARESICGERVGALPTPVRRGYRFDGWYVGEELFTEETVVDSEEDLRLVARWSREDRGSVQVERRSGLKKQKIALIALSIAVVALAIVLVVVLELITIYSLTDVYVIDGVEYRDTYSIKRQDGVYMLFDKDGRLMDTNAEKANVYIAAGSGNQYKIDPSTGSYSLVAIVDTDDYEVVPGTNLMMYPQIASEDIYSISVKHADGTGYTFFNDGKQVYIDGFKNKTVQYDKDLYAKLCATTGYTLTVMKLDIKSEDSTVPRLEDGSVNYSAYGLDTPVASFTVTAAKDPDASVFEPHPTKSYTVLLGDKTVADTGYYVKLENTSAIYILTSERIDQTVMQPIENLVDARVTIPVEMNYHSMAKDFYLAYLESWMGEENLSEPIVAFDYEDLDYRINTMKQNYPYISDSKLLEGMSGYKINDTNASKVLQFFFEMTPNACVKLGITTEALEKYGLSEDVYYLTYQTKTGEYDENGNELYGINRMLISQKNEDGVHYVASFLYDMILEVDQYYLSFLEWDNIDWYNKYFMSMNILYAQEISFQFGDQTYEFVLDNDLSYMYYLVRDSEQSEIKMTFVDLSKGYVIEENGSLYYIRNSDGKRFGKLHSIFDGSTLVSYEYAMKNPTQKKVFYVEDLYYYRNASDQNVQVVPNFKDDRIELRDDKYYYIYTVNGQEMEIRVSKTTGNLVYRHGQYSLENDENGDGKIQSSEKTYYFVTSSVDLGTAGLKVFCDQFTGGEGADKNLLDYTIDITEKNDSGIEESESISATDNFRKLHMQMLTIALEGDVDEKEFKRNTGMTVKEFLASGVAPDVTISTLSEDFASYLNSATKRDENGNTVRIYEENIEEYLIYRFYSYTEWKSLVTIEKMVKDENGNWVSSGAVSEGRFYVNSSVLDKMQTDIGRILNKELIDYNTKY